LERKRLSSDYRSPKSPGKANIRHIVGSMKKLKEKKITMEERLET
jgi:hypothetical protein